MNDGTWYRTGTVSLTNGSDLVNGVGTAFIDNVFIGGIFFSPAGLLEITRVISDTQLQLVAPYGGASGAGLAFAVAPTQGAVVAATKQLQSFMTTLGPLKLAWEAGDLVAKGLVLKGVKGTEADLPASGNRAGDGWLVNGTLFVWTGTNWADQGKLVTTPALEALRDEVVAAADVAVPAAATAVSAKDTATAIVNRRVSTAAGLADTSIPNGGYFSTPSADVKEAAIVWRKVDGVAVEGPHIPSADGLRQDFIDQATQFIQLNTLVLQHLAP